MEAEKGMRQQMKVSEWSTDGMDVEGMGTGRRRGEEWNTVDREW